FLDLVYGDKNVFSTVRDLYKWDQALRSGQIFTKGVMDSAYTPYSFEKPGKRNYGLGWRMLLEPNGKRLIYHNGWWHGNRTVFIRMLDEDATIIALCNNDYKKIYSAKRLCDLFGDYRQGTELFEEAEPDANGSGGSGGDPHLAQSTQTTQATQAATPPSPTHRVHRRRRHHTAHPVHTT
ncbi:MAG: serine hydrolase, partial [Bacteroidota bacterium]|nr:serine hydrolase [Bacteroidota bacterium]